MKDKLLQIRVNDEFFSKIDYLQKINGLKTISDTVRKIIEKEFNKETQNKPPISDWTNSDMWKFTKDHANCFVKSWGGYIGKNDGYDPYGYQIDFEGKIYYFGLDGHFIKEKAQ